MLQTVAVGAIGHVRSQPNAPCVDQSYTHVWLIKQMTFTLALQSKNHFNLRTEINCDFWLCLLTTAYIIIPIIILQLLLLLPSSL